jgi:type I pantothenate kinase
MMSVIQDLTPTVALAPDVDRLADDLVRRVGDATLLVGVAGSVGVGKSTFATQLAARLKPHVSAVQQIVSTDGFLLPNAVLEPRGLIERKGFPESYDHDRLVAFLDRAQAGRWPIEVPSYSHEVFDVGPSRWIDRADVVIVEGINVLQDPFESLLDVSIYLDTSEEIVRGWFVDRMHSLVHKAGEHPGGFYDRFVDWPFDRLTTFAEHVWDTINLPNLRDHIAPSRTNADWIVRFDQQHTVVEVTNHA